MLRPTEAEKDIALRFALAFCVSRFALRLCFAFHFSLCALRRVSHSSHRKGSWFKGYVPQLPSPRVAHLLLQTGS